jgi:hypothetical protein
MPDVAEFKPVRARSIQAIAIPENLPARHTYEATPDL